MEEGSKGSASVELPQDIMVDIISRLPVKSLLRFKCVCKIWNSLISKPNFVLSASSRERVVVMCSPFTRSVSAGLAMATFYSVDDKLAITKVPSPLGDFLVTYSNFACVGSYNGMVLFYANKSFRMWNPSTGRCSLFGQLNGLTNRFRESHRIISGLCFDKTSDDYKVLLVTTRRPLGVGASDTIVHVASLKKWRIQKDLLIYFDEEIDQFKELPMPEDDNGGLAYYFGLAILDGCLCLSRVAKRYEDFNRDNDDNDVFVMAEYGVKHSWTKRFTIKGLLVPLRLRTPDNLVLVSRRGHLYTYNLESKDFTSIKVTLNPLQERSYHIRHKATGESKRYNLRDNLHPRINSGPAVLDICAGPIMFTESLASVDCMKCPKR
ncbi:OLC1v1008776C1 [Oldenlandia corymbosa var. corymbosa]|uniref:OLC1v1008776C1 n=1 Tax=Oldenlandia corymbosa var. corymbosa TaxID=529605 RepID=A0AAV1DMY3_OLDCO|nr:OLC1v1008776C1 [Oldenlandia corymbosa var. corymbosa]